MDGVFVHDQLGGRRDDRQFALDGRQAGRGPGLICFHYGRTGGVLNGCFRLVQHAWRWQDGIPYGPTLVSRARRWMGSQYEDFVHWATIFRTQGRYMSIRSFCREQ